MSENISPARIVTIARAAELRNLARGLSPSKAYAQAPLGRPVSLELAGRLCFEGDTAQRFVDGAQLIGAIPRGMKLPVKPPPSGQDRRSHANSLLAAKASATGTFPVFLRQDTAFRRTNSRAPACMGRRFCRTSRRQRHGWGPGMRLVRASIAAVCWVPMLSIPYTPAYSAEIWDCPFKIAYGRDQGLDGAGRIEIEGDTLNWMVLVPKAPPDPEPTWAKFPCKILQNNSVGAVSVASSAEVRPSRPLIVGLVTVLSKSSGDFRQSSVAPEGTFNVMTGRCKQIGSE